MAAGSIYPFSDKAHFESTYRTICLHKNIQLDLSHLSIDGSPLDLHQLHLLVFNEGGETKVNEKDLWGDLASRMGFNDPFSLSATQRPFTDSNREQHLLQPAVPPSHSTTTTATTTTITATITEPQRQQPLATPTSSSITNGCNTNSNLPQQLSRVYKLYLSFFDLAIQENIAQNRARAQAAMQATSAAAAAATATHPLIPHGIPLIQFLTQHVGLQQSYIDGITPQQRFLLLEWTQLSEDELRNKVKVPDNVVDMVAKVKEKLKSMKEVVGQRPQPPPSPPPPPLPPLPPPTITAVVQQAPPPSTPLPVPVVAPTTTAVVPAGNNNLANLPPPTPGPLQTGVRFISSGLKGEPLPAPEPKMGSKASFDVVYRLILECKITEDSLDRSLDSIIVPAEKLPEHHALLDKVSQACTEIDAKLAMIHDVLQQENYIKRMIIIASQIVYQKTLLTKPDWERRYVLTVDMLKSMLAEIQYLVGLYNQKIRGLMDAFQSTASQHGHDAAVQQLPSWVQVQLQQQAQQAAQAPPPPAHLTPEEYAAMSPEQRHHARQIQRAHEAEEELVKFREGFLREGPEEVIRWIENRCRPLKSVYEEYMEQRRVLEERLREREREREEEEEEKRYSALGRRRWSLREEIDTNKGRTGIVSKRIKAPVKSEWSIDGTMGLPFTEEEHAAAVLFVQCATQEFGALPATAQMLSWDTDLTPEEIKEYHRLHDKGYRQYQEYGPKTALLHLLMGQDSTTKRFIVIGYVLSYQQHVFATGTKRYILTLDQLEEWVEDYGDIIEEFIERKNAMHREQVEAHMRSMGRMLDLSGVDIGMLNGTPVGGGGGAVAAAAARKNRNKNNKKKKKKKTKNAMAEEDEDGEEDEEEKMVDVLVGVVDFLEMYKSRM